MPNLAPSPALRARDFASSLADSQPNSSATIPLGRVPLFPESAESLSVTPSPRSNLMRSTLAGSRGSKAFGEHVTMPQPGDAFLGFRLVEEIGHGTFARVFLAKQESLAGRDVVLKVTLRATREPERIARLQHTNVVPVYSVHNAAPVQIICMPYLGRRTLADILTGYRKSQAAPGQSTRKGLATRKGSSVAGSRSRTTFRIPEETATAASAETPAANPLVGDVDAVLQILLQLAEGLAHAHERGILHLDLKPANVLVADTGEPMLLDFNLSYASFEGNREVVGGTVPYMAPEQLLDMKTRGQGTVDARTDLYSLGVMAFELLAGKYPFPISPRLLSEFDGLIAARKQGPPPLRELNPNVSPAVEAIVRKLLAPNPADRYQHALDLREDLDRQLTDRPLVFAVDRSLPERLGKWRRRHPRALAAMMLVAALAATGASGAYAINQSEQRAVGQAEARARDIKDSLDLVRLDLVMPNDKAARARGMKKAMELLGAFNLPRDPGWKAKSVYQSLPASQRPALEGDLGELLLLVAAARWQDGQTVDRAGAARDALQLNQLAAGCFGAAPPAFLLRQKAELEGKPFESPAPLAATSREAFLDGTRLMAAGKYTSASEMLEKAVLAEPNHGAAQFCLAYCRQELGQFIRAVERYEVARGLLPGDPRPLYFCGVSHGRNKAPASAEDYFTKAIEIDSTQGDFYRGRAFARIDQGEWKEAESDLTEALKHAASPVQILSVRATIRERLGNREDAAIDRKALAEKKPESASDLVALGWSRLPGDPKAALVYFRAATEKDPHSLAALRNQEYILSDLLRDDTEALKIMDRIADLYPEYALNHARRAALLARLGQRETAHRESALAGKLTHDSHVTYIRACTYAITSKTHREDRKLAMELLKQAFRDGYCKVHIYETDPNLDVLRDLPEFAELLKALKRLS